MIKPTKFRMVKFLYKMVKFYPEGNYFTPWGKKDCEPDQVEIRVDEIEAIRLKDVEGLTIEDCASKMAISCEAFQNLIKCARKKIAIALTQNKIISIVDGNYTTKFCKFRCAKCGYTYTVKYEHDKIICPKCFSTEVMGSEKQQSHKKIIYFY